MTNPWTMKLRYGADLSDADSLFLDRISKDVQAIKPRQDLIREGDRPKYVHLIKEGVACRYKVANDGQQKILAWLIPGDICDLHVALLGEMDHNIRTITACKIAFMPAEIIDEILATHPSITRALWWNTLVDEGILRQWLVTGSASAEKRIAHLFCEVLVRLQSVGHASESGCIMPVTQAELGETTGMSTVHVNRTLQNLREEGLFVFANQKLTVPDVDRLKKFAEFNPNYLHLSKRTGNSRGSSTA